MIFKSRQVNLDPEPYAHYYDRTDRSSFGNDLPGGLRIYAPRPEFEPTRDPAPWWNPAEVIQTGNYARSSEQLPGYNYAPRREEFDTPVNRVLETFRQSAERRLLLDAPDAFLIGASGWATPEEIEHARRVLIRLARQ